jgi:hypothetical protein
MSSLPPDGPPIVIEDVEESRTNGNSYRPLLNLRENLLIITDISNQYDEQSSDVRRGFLPDRSLDWITSSDFYRGASSTINEMVSSSSAFRNLFTNEISK